MSPRPRGGSRSVGRASTTNGGKAALYLASAMSSYVTGIVLPVDGGSWASSGWFRTRDGTGWALHDTAGYAPRGSSDS